MLHSNIVWGNIIFNKSTFNQSIFKVNTWGRSCRNVRHFFTTKSKSFIYYMNNREDLCWELREWNYGNFSEVRTRRGCNIERGTCIIFKLSFNIKYFVIYFLEPYLWGICYLLRPCSGYLQYKSGLKLKLGNFYELSLTFICLGA